MWLELQEEVFHMSYFFKEFRRQCWFLVYLTSVLISCVFRRQYWFLVYFDVSTDFFCISTSVLISCVFRRQYWFLLYWPASYYLKIIREFPLHFLISWQSCFGTEQCWVLIPPKPILKFRKCFFKKIWYLFKQ